MNAAEVRMIVTIGSFVPRCQAYYTWIALFDDQTPALEIFNALPSRYSTWLREFFKSARLAPEFMDDFDALWRRYIDCLASAEDQPDIVYADWHDECFGALKQDLLARPWLQMLLQVELLPAFEKIA